MGTQKIVELTDEEIERVGRETAERDKTRPRASEVRYDDSNGRIVIDLVNGSTLLIPPRLLQGLEKATKEELSNIETFGNGNYLNWPSKDVQFTVEGLACGLFGTKAWMRRIAAAPVKDGSKSRTTAKQLRPKSAKDGRSRRVIARHT